MIARLGQILRFVLKYLAGVICCTALPLSVLIVGWTYRLMQRSAFKRWHAASPVAADMPFADFAAADPGTSMHRRWPNWFIRQREGRWLGDSLWLNFRRGVGGLFNTWVFTLPGCILWLFAWYDGWNNSFYKGYEQAAVGPLTGLLGTMLFIAAMFYVPMAQARQAVAGDWRRFYDFRIVWRLIRRSAWSCVALAALYTLTSVPVMIFKTAPMAFDRFPHYAQLTDAQVLANLHRYFFMTALVVFPIYVLLHVAASRVYARALSGAIRDGQIAADELAPDERHVLDRLDLLHPAPAQPRHPVVRAAAWTGTRLGRFTAAAITAVIWFTFVSQIFVSEFLNYHPIIGWINQPLVQLPFFSYIPAALLGH